MQATAGRCSCPWNSYVGPEMCWMGGCGYGKLRTCLPPTHTVTATHTYGVERRSHIQIHVTTFGIFTSALLLKSARYILFIYIRESRDELQLSSCGPYPNGNSRHTNSRDDFPPRSAAVRHLRENRVDESHTFLLCSRLRLSLRTKVRGCSCKSQLHPIG